MNQISDLPNPLKILFQEYNQGQIESVGFRSFTLHAGESNSYRTLKSALIVPVSGRAIFSFEHEPFIAKRRLFLHGCPNKTLTISAMPFLGGVRAVIPEKNILIDNSFETLLNEERENFIFHGGVEHE